MILTKFRAKNINNNDDVIGDLFAGKFIIPISILNKKILSAIKHIEEDVLSCSINEDCKNEHIELKNMLTKLIYNERLEHITEIDITTLAIHFSNMLDNQGNKIFASLSEDGKGGDILEYDDMSGTAYFDKSTYSIRAETNKGFLMSYEFKNSKIIGIQK